MRNVTSVPGSSLGVLYAVGGNVTVSKFFVCTFCTTCGAEDVSISLVVQNEVQKIEDVVLQFNAELCYQLWAPSFLCIFNVRKELKVMV